MGKKIVVPSLDVIMIAFFPRNIQRKTIKLIPSEKTDRAHAPWASHNTHSIEVIQYGRRIGK